MTLEGRRRMIVGVTGATGIIYAVRLLKALRQLEIETHLVISKPAEMAAACEWPEPIKSIRAGADVNYRISDISAAIASGSFRTMGMIVAPCSARTVAEIASGTSSNLLNSRSRRLPKGASSPRADGAGVYLNGAYFPRARARRSRATRSASRPTRSSRLGGASPISFSRVLFRVFQIFPATLVSRATRNQTDPLAPRCWPPSPFLEFGLGAGAAAAAPDSMVWSAAPGERSEVRGLRQQPARNRTDTRERSMSSSRSRFSGCRSRSLSLSEGLTDLTGARDGTRAHGVLDRGRRRLFSF